MPDAKIKKDIDQGQIVIIDGGTGTELEKRGVEMDPNAWCGRANLDGFDTLVDVHSDYISAGAQIITTNTYASSRLMLSPSGLGDRTKEINQRAFEACATARDKVKRPDVAIAGSVSHAVPMIPGTSTSDRSQMPSETEMFEAFQEVATIHKESGCDLMMLEMMFDPIRVRLATEAALSTGLPVWTGLSAKRGADGKVYAFTQDEDQDWEELVKLAVSYDVEAAGIMHTPANVTTEALPALKKHFKGPLTAYPDSGYFKAPNWQFHDIIPPNELAEFAKLWAESGVQVFGGCCGLSPEHIQALSQEFKA